MILVILQLPAIFISHPALLTGSPDGNSIFIEVVVGCAITGCNRSLPGHSREVGCSYARLKIKSSSSKFDPEIIVSIRSIFLEGNILKVIQNLLWGKVCSHI